MSIITIERMDGTEINVLNGCFVIDDAKKKASFRCNNENGWVLCDRKNNTSIFEITYLDGTSQTLETDLDDLSNYIHRTINVTNIRTCNFKQIKSSVIDISNLFGIWYSNYATNMTEFICEADLKNVKYMYGTWESCKSLTSFPLINTSNVVSLGEAWNGCMNLTSFPLLDTSNVTGFFATWMGCSSLTSFPAITLRDDAYYGETWKDCTNLTNFESDFNCANYTNGTFENCPANPC